MTWPNTTLLTGDTVIAELRRMKAERDGDLVVVGSAALARQLIADGLVDEYRLMIEPILLGGGKRLVPRGHVVAPPGAGVGDDRRHRRAGLHVPSGLTPIQAATAADARLVAGPFHRRAGRSVRRVPTALSGGRPSSESTNYGTVRLDQSSECRIDRQSGK